MLIELGLLERLAGDVLTRLIHKRIENHVQETCKGSFDTSYTNTLEEVVDNSCFYLLKAKKSVSGYSLHNQSL